MEKYFYELYAVLAILYALTGLVTVRVMRRLKRDHAGARGALAAGPIATGLAWIYGCCYRFPLVARVELKSQWTRLVPLALCAALVWLIVRVALRTKTTPFRPLFAALSLGPTWFVGSVAWSIANVLTEDRLHGVGAALDARKEHAIWTGLAFAAVGLLVAAFLARTSAAPDPVAVGKISDDAPAPSPKERAARRRRRRS